MQKFTIPTKAYYEITMPDGSKRRLLLPIGKEYSLEELQLEVEKQRSAHDIEGMAQLLRERLQGESVKSVTIDGDFYKIDFGGVAVRVNIASTYLVIPKPL